MESDYNTSSSSELRSNNSNNLCSRIKLNVGGRLFETSVSTLQSGGPDSLLAALSLSTRGPPSPPPSSINDEDDEDEDDDVIFIDRDPDVFSVLLSLLRSGRLPSTAARFSKQDLVEESQYYGIESRLRSAMSPPPLLGIDATLSSTIHPTADAFPTAISAHDDDDDDYNDVGSLLWIAHGGQISSYNWNLSYVGTVRTHLDEITSLRRVWPDLSAIGSLHSPGLHFYDISSGRHAGSAHWSDPSDPRVYKARVTAIAASRGPAVFAAFECPHWENCILSVDRTTLQIVSEIGRQNGSSSKVAAPGKLVHVAETGLLFASAVSSGSFGYTGYMRLWDPRSRGSSAVWETCEPGGVGRSNRFGDSFADADVDREDLAIYKVCWNSGDVAVADMRMLGPRSDDPWFYLQDNRGAGLRSAGRGQNSVLHCYKKQVFVSCENGLEVCSRPVEEIIPEEEQGREEERSAAGGEGTSSSRISGIGRRTMGTYMRNFMDREEDAKRGMIRKMEGGGNRLFVSRDGMEGIEVWESSHFSGAISLL